MAKTLERMRKKAELEKLLEDLREATEEEQELRGCC